MLKEPGLTVLKTIAKAASKHLASKPRTNKSIIFGETRDVSNTKCFGFSQILFFPSKNTIEVAMLDIIDI